MGGKVFLVHWNGPEAEQYANKLRKWGWNVEMEFQDGARGGKRIKEDQPDVVVIYLTRLPSHGRETADALRSIKATRQIPIVFVDGKEEAVEKTRARVPDALFVASAELEGTLTRLAQATLGMPKKAPAPQVGTAQQSNQGFRNIREEVVVARTGKSSEEWYAILDQWDAAQKGHTRTAKYLLDERKLSPWWAQCIAIRYEWERGLRK